MWITVFFQKHLFIQLLEVLGKMHLSDLGSGYISA